MNDYIKSILSLSLIVTVTLVAMNLIFGTPEVDAKAVEERITLEFSDTEARLLETEYDIKEIMATIDSIDCKLDELAAKRMN